MKPYYEQDGVTIYHGDCREVVFSLDADCFVTDPPYGINFKGKATKHTTAHTGGYASGTDDEREGPDMIADLISRCKRGAVFCGAMNLSAYPKYRDLGGVFCPAGAGMGAWGFRCFHPVIFYGDRPHSAMSPTCIQSFDTADDCGHPCPKPQRWMTWLVALASSPGDIVLDPFMGSGTTLVAAKQLGRRAIGIEIEERYCEIAAKRLAQGVLDLTQ
jgi:DNA modification methylase